MKLSSFPLRRVLAIGFLGLVCAAAYWVGAQTNNTTINGGLQVDTKYLDMGEVWENIDFPWTVPIHNPTNKSITIEKFVASCQCLEIEPETFTVDPGETLDVRLRLDLTRLPSGEKGIRPFSIGFAPIIEKSANQEQGWTLTGLVRKGLNLPERLLVFSDPLIQVEPNPKKSIVILADQLVRTVSTTYDRSLLEVNVTSKIDGQYQLETTIAHTAPLGPFRAEVNIFGNLADGSRHSSTRAIVRGHVVRGIQFTPETLLLGRRSLGETVEEQVVLRSVTGKPFIIESIEKSSSDLDLIGATANSSEAVMELLLKQRISKVGDQKETAIIVVRHIGKDTPMRIPLSISYFGRPIQNLNVEGQP